MRNKYGFTLVELMGILVVLALILIVAVPSITTTLRGMNEKKIEEYENRVCTAAIAMVGIDRTKLNEPISVKELKDGDFLSNSLKNPHKDATDAGTVITIKRNDQHELVCVDFVAAAEPPTPDGPPPLPPLVPPVTDVASYRVAMCTAAARHYWQNCSGCTNNQSYGLTLINGQANTANFRTYYGINPITPPWALTNPATVQIRRSGNTYTCDQWAFGGTVPANSNIPITLTLEFIAAEPYVIR